MKHQDDSVHFVHQVVNVKSTDMKQLKVMN